MAESTTHSTESTSVNFFLDGNFRPVAEERDAQDMTVIGTLPDDLAGTFLRIGPNPVHIFSEEKYHTFDGDGMIHAIEFERGTARYRNRFVQTEGLKLEQERGDWVYKGMNSMMDPSPSRVPEARHQVRISPIPPSPITTSPCMRYMNPLNPPLLHFLGLRPLVQQTSAVNLNTPSPPTPK